MTRKQTKPTPQKLLAEGLGLALRDYRQASGLSTRQLAAVTGISQQSIVQFEHGKHAPSLLNAMKLARFFGFSLDTIVMSLKKEI